MKRRFFVPLLAAVAPIGLAWAAPVKPSTPAQSAVKKPLPAKSPAQIRDEQNTEVDTTTEAAAALMKRAIATYKGTSRISFTVANFLDGKDDGTLRIQLILPDRLSQVSRTDKKTQRILLTGRTLYIIDGNRYVHDPTTPPAKVKYLLMLPTSYTYFGSCFLRMIDGISPISVIHQYYFGQPDLYKDVHSRTTALPAQIIDGERLVVVKNTVSYINILYSKAIGHSIREVDERTYWFGGTPFVLRRTQLRTTANGITTTHLEKITSQQVNPVFAADTFKFNAAGLTEGLKSRERQGRRRPSGMNSQSHSHRSHLTSASFTLNG